MRSVSAVVLAAMLVLASMLHAQEPASAPPASSGSPAPANAIDPTKLGIDLSKVQKGLAVGTPEERLEANGLHLTYNVQVFGKAPELDLFKDFDLVNGPVPFGAPTHKDFLEQVTPIQFRAPAANFAALAFWAVRKISDAGERQRCEAELAAYREQLMQGINVAAPACAR